MTNRKGIILAGGKGSRLYPSTKVISKQLLPIYNKPTIYYSLSTLMNAFIKEILIITTSEDLPQFEKLLEDGHHLGLNINYTIQPSPDGLAQALILAEEFLDGSPSALVLGDNIFYGNDFRAKLKLANEDLSRSTIFAYHVDDPERYGVVKFNDSFDVMNIEEKPKTPKSNYAVTGLYFYDKNAPKYAKKLNPSERGELEITDLNNIYLKKKLLKVTLLNRGYTWFDTGTHDSMLEASNFIKTIETLQGLKIGCLEEISYKNNWISKKDLKKLIENFKNSQYAEYLLKILR